MNRRSTALIVILSLLVIFVTNTLAQAEKNGTDSETPKETLEGVPSGVTEGPTPEAEGSTPKSGATYPVIGAIATAVIANFF
ncbi:hypothetical protein L5515_002106 [Caenorhabditis briggsae]|uniref:Uncharacterized protein n=1 Tax=Caenorhabditis briggsae TaxID=6238 RepID=A0AAE9J3U7_CAEBR|nr:hypothetical protein L5515_002106 [Caenorhabditis briggsae]